MNLEMSDIPENQITEECSTSGAQQRSSGADRPNVLRRIANKFVHGKGIFTFLRSSVSSQIASWIDMGVCFVFYAWVFLPLGKDPMRSFMATAIGLVAGGVVNCCINYKFTFKTEHCPVKAVAVKYFMVWAGSFMLNLGGTTFLDWLLQRLTFLQDLGWLRPDGIFAVARLTVSLIVSLAWNFLMQKNFVYVSTRFDPTAIKIVDRLTFHRKNSGKPACNQD